MNQTILFSKKATVRALLSLIGVLLFCEHSFPQQMNSKAVTEGIPLSVSAGWNLLSLPANITNGNKTLLFPNAISQAFTFDGQSGYQSRDTLTNGMGFWMKFGASETILIPGKASFSDTLALVEGWNIIGALAVPIAVNSLQTNPVGIIASPFYAFVPGAGYQQVDTLQPGRGYWVKTNQSGTILPQWSGIVYNDSTLLPEELPNFQSVDVDSNQLTFTFDSAEDLPTLFPGQILFGILDSGYARKVVSYITNGNQLIVQTEFARFDEVVDVANIDTTIVFTLPDTVMFNKLLNEALDYKDSSNGANYRITTGKPEILSFRDGTITLQFPNWGVQLNLSPNDQFAIKSKSLTVTVSAPTLHINQYVNNGSDIHKFLIVQTESFEFEDVLFTFRGVLDTTWKVPIIPRVSLGRVVSPYVAGVLELFSVWNFGAKAQMTAAIGLKSSGNIIVNAAYQAGFELSDTLSLIWNPVLTVTNDAKFNATGGLSASLKVFLQPTFELQWNRFAKASLYPQGFGYVDVSAFPFSIVTGLGLGLGADFSLRPLFPLSGSMTIAEQKWPLWTTKGPDEPKNPIPANNAAQIKDTVTLRWTGTHPTNDPLLYDVYFGTDNPPQTMIATNLTSKSFFVNNLTNGTAYFWKIETREEDGDTTVGPIWKFSVDTIPPAIPVLVSPPNEDTAQLIPTTLRWNNSAHAGTYTLEVSTDSLFNYLIAEHSNLTDTSKALNGLDEGVMYFWRVKAVNPSGESNWSEVWSFSTKFIHLPPTPNLVSPENDTRNTPLGWYVVWERNLRTSNYTLQVSTDNTFTSINFEHNVMQTSEPAINMRLDAVNGSTTYFWRVKAHNSIGESNWSTVFFFKTITVSSCSGGTLIGSQCWKTQNLNLGTMLLYADTTSPPPSDNGIIEKFCYDNNAENCSQYGGLYTWAEAMNYSTTEGARGICPSGWHIPTGNEWRTLADVYVASNRRPLLKVGVAEGTNTSGFSGVLGGTMPDFYGGQWGWWWSSSLNEEYIEMMYINGGLNGAIGVSRSSENTFSVRCIKN